MYVPDNVVSLEQVGTGFVIDLPRVTEQVHFTEWYEQNYKNLFKGWGSPSVTNGLSLFDRRDLAEMPLFWDASRYYQDAINVEAPDFVTEDEAMNAWLDEELGGETARGSVGTRRLMLIKAIKRAVEHWSIMGRLVLASFDDGRLRAIKPFEHIAVKDIVDEDVTIGHILMYPWYDKRADTKQTQIIVNNKIRIVRFDNETRQSTVQDFEFGGGEQTGAIGAAVTDEEPSDITGIWDGGEDDGFYRQIARAAGMLMVRLTLSSKAYNRFSDPHLLAPQAAFDSQQRTFQTPGDPAVDSMRSTTPSLAQQLTEGRGTVIPIDPSDTSDYRYLTYNVDESAALGLTEFLQHIILRVTGVPASAMGIDMGAGESGEARAMGMIRGERRINDLRDQITNLIPDIFKAMGAPDTDDLMFTWGRAYMQQKAEQAMQQMAQQEGDDEEA